MARWPRIGRRLRQLLVLTVSLAVATNVVGAQRDIDWSTRPVLLLTMGQGEEVFEKFGHNALIVWDDAAGQPLVYNWGMFDFAQPNFLGRFLTGDTRYWMQPFSMEQTLDAYQRLNRTMTVQALNLTPAQKTRLVQMLATNALEANKFYRYDYYRDNCSTRVRDAIDAVTGGVMKRAMQSQPGQGSYRWHTRRLLAYSTPLYLGSELVLGIHADAPLTSWEEAFLPQSLAQAVTRIELPAADGMPARPLAAPIDTLFRATREPEPRTVEAKLGQAAIVGIGIGALIFGLALLGRLGAAVAIGGWSLLCALIGTVLLLAWFATQHVYMGNNPSVAVANPLWLSGLVVAVMVTRRGVSPGAHRLLQSLLVLAVVGVAGAVMSGHAVSALEMAALFLPGHAAVVAAAGRSRQSDVTPRSSTFH